MKIKLSTLLKQQVLAHGLVGWGLLVSFATVVNAQTFTEQRGEVRYERVQNFESLSSKEHNWKLFNNLTTGESEFYINKLLKWQYNARTGERKTYFCDNSYHCEVTLSLNGLDLMTETKQYSIEELSQPYNEVREIR